MKQMPLLNYISRFFCPSVGIEFELKIDDDYQKGKNSIFLKPLSNIPIDVDRLPRDCIDWLTSSDSRFQEY